MPVKLLYLLFFSATLLVNSAHSQTISSSLQNESYGNLEKRIEILSAGNKTKDLVIVQKAYLNKALADKNWEKVSKAYEGLAFSASEPENLAYCDSMMDAALKSDDKETIGSAYLTKGMVYYSIRNLSAALDNFIKANDLLKDSANADLQHTVKYGISTIKYYLGFYDEASVLLQECCTYFKGKDEEGYLNSMQSLALCYNKMGRFDLCTKINKEGLEIAQKSKNQLAIAYIKHTEAVNHLAKKKYHHAIGLFKDALPLIIENEDFSNEMNTYFYLGKSYMALGEKETAISYFRKVDKIFTTKNFIRPDLRENFEILINYYKQNGDIEAQLHYINKLLRADKILNADFKYLSGKIHKEYDTRQLVDAKKDIEIELASKKTTNVILYIAIAILFILILVLLYRYYKNQQTYRKKFEELMQQEKQGIPEVVVATAEITTTKKTGINPDVVTAILKQLEKFERNKKFLQKELTLVNLASSFSTNTNYLSKVISSSRSKNYITYLNDLRIDYVVNLLKEEPKYRNYTIKALADEAGFSTPQHFSKAFFARTGIYPSYFVNELNKELPATA